MLGTACFKLNPRKVDSVHSSRCTLFTATIPLEYTKRPSNNKKKDKLVLRTVVHSSDKINKCRR